MHAHFSIYRKQVEQLIYRYKTDLVFILVFTLIYSVLMAFLWGHTTNHIFFIDFGRELYIPQQMLKGQLLYKDIFNHFGPLAYQINALLYYIFGVSTNVIYAAGAVVGYLFTISLYAIARFFVPIRIAIALAFAMLFVHTLYHNSFIRPYSFSLAYGIVFINYSLLATLIYSRSKKINWLYISSLLYGLAITSKYEFIGFIVILAILAYKVRTLSLREWFICLVSIVCIPLFSLTVLISSGVSFQDLLNTIDFVIRFAQSDSLNRFYRQTSSFDIRALDIPPLLTKFVSYVGIIFIPVLIVVKSKYLLLQSIIIKLCLCVAWIGIFVSSIYLVGELFPWLPLFSFITLLFLLYLSWRRPQNLISKEFILAASSTTISMKALFFSNHNVYGVFLTYLPLLLFLIIGYRVLLQYIPDPKAPNVYGLSIVAFSFLFYIPTLITTPSIFESSVLNTEHGPVRIHTKYMDTYLQLVHYIESETQPEDKIIVLPEGQIINFLTNRDADNQLSVLFSPPFIETYGEVRLLNLLDSSKTEYIIIANIPLNGYFNTGKIDKETLPILLGVGYGESILDHINTRYDKVQTFGQYELFTIYKLK